VCEKGEGVVDGVWKIPVEVLMKAVMMMIEGLGAVERVLKVGRS
jgi:hypothetical protein